MDRISKRFCLRTSVVELQITSANLLLTNGGTLYHTRKIQFKNVFRKIKELLESYGRKTDTADDQFSIRIWNWSDRSQLTMSVQWKDNDLYAAIFNSGEIHYYEDDGTPVRLPKVIDYLKLEKIKMKCNQF